MRRQSQRGYILIMVAVFGTIATMVMSSVFNGGVIQEQRALDNRLAEMRAYWAIMGHFQYVFSRGHQQKYCNITTGACDPLVSIQDVQQTTVVQSYLGEITAYRRFAYPEESANYWIDIALTAMVDDYPLKHLHAQWLVMQSSFPNTQSTLPVLSGLATRFKPLEVRFCTNMTTQATACGVYNANNFGGTLNGLYRIRRLSRM
jgi:hypothetical protein